MSEPTVRVEVDGAIGWMVFDHHARRNAMTIDMWRAVPGLCDELSRDENVRVVVLRGAGDVAFVAGADISQFNEQRDPNNSDSYANATSSAWAAIESIDKPVIAMVHGFCIGGGLAIALSADIRYCAEDGQFGLPPAKLGIGYESQGVGKLVDLVGPSTTKELIFTADQFSAAQALQMGLVNRVLPKADLEPFVREQAATMATRAPLSQRAAKLAVADHLRPESQRRPDEVRAAISTCMRSADYAEGVKAFMEKRRPVFTGH